MIRLWRSSKGQWIWELWRTEGDIYLLAQGSHQFEGSAFTQAMAAWRTHGRQDRITNGA